jgi:hypothetical protein
MEKSSCVTNITKYVELLQISLKDVMYSIKVLSSTLHLRTYGFKYTTVISKCSSIHCLIEERRGRNKGTKELKGWKTKGVNGTDAEEMNPRKFKRTSTLLSSSSSSSSSSSTTTTTTPWS